VAQDRPATYDVPPGGVERRRYNRRTGPTAQNPPYFEIFERIALALEGIQDAVSQRPSGPGLPTPRGE
jgi:hypothetical protein